jgi:hypothetical protein
VAAAVCCEQNQAQDQIDQIQQLQLRLDNARTGILTAVLVPQQFQQQQRCRPSPPTT